MIEAWIEALGAQAAMRQCVKALAFYVSRRLTPKGGLPQGDCCPVVIPPTRRAKVDTSDRMAATWFALLLQLIAARSILATKEWQYFCFDSAAAFGRISTTTIFSVLPDPGGKPPPATPPPPAAPLLNPEVKEEADPTAAAPTEAIEAAEEGADEGPSLTPVDRAARHLKSLDGTCYFMRVGYWTYEVCPWKTVRQYHTETGAAGGAAVHNEFSLGKYLSTDDSWNDQTSTYVQQFVQGTEGRGSTVRYMCPDSWRDEDGVVVVHEPRPKQYVVTVRVQALCGATKRSAALKGDESGKRSSRKEKEAAKAVRRKLKEAEMAKREAAKKAAAAAERAKPGGASAVAEDTAAGTASGASGPMQIAELVLPNTRLLGSIRGRCFSMVRDYWTYEFCPMQHVRQYRQEGNRVGASFSLGTYEKSLDKVTVGVRGALDRNLVPHAFAQSYTNGTANRKAQVRVRCSTKNEHSLIAVDEPAMHEYVMLFSSPLGCELSCAYAFSSVAED